MKEVPAYLCNWVIMRKHGNPFDIPHLMGLDQLPKPIRQRRPGEYAVRRCVRLEVAHHYGTMAQRHDLPGQPANDGVDAVKIWFRGPCQPLYSSNGKAAFIRQAIE